MNHLIALSFDVGIYQMTLPKYGKNLSIVFFAVWLVANYLSLFCFVHADKDLIYLLTYMEL